MREELSNEFELQAEDVVGALGVVQDDAAQGLLAANEAVFVEDHSEPARCRLAREPSLAD